MAKSGGEEIYTQGCGEKTEGKRPHGRFRYGWEDNIRIDLKYNEGHKLDSSGSD
jgi:hypothetical protein